MSRKGRRDKQRGRRALDYRAMMSLDGEVLQVRPYAGYAAITAGQVATPEQGAAGEVTLYDVACTAALPVSATEAATGITTRYDVSGSEYPVLPPSAMVVSPKKPLTTHVHRESGVVCIGPLWQELKGKELLAELVLRVVRAYNYQDPATDELGFQPAALFYRRTLRGRPFNPDLVLPAVPDDVFQIVGAAESRPRVAVVVGEATPRRDRRVSVAAPRASRLEIVSGGGS